MAATDAECCLPLPEVLNVGTPPADPLWGMWCPHDKSYSGVCACQPCLTGSVVRVLAASRGVSQAGCC